MSFLKTAANRIESEKTRRMAIVKLITLMLNVAWELADDLASFVPEGHARDAAQLGIFMVLVLGAIALVVVSIVLLFGMDISGQFADSMVSDPDHVYAEEANNTVDATGSSFDLFGTSTLVIPAAAVLAVLIGGLVGAINMRNGGLGLNGNGGNTQVRRRGR